MAIVYDILFFFLTLIYLPVYLFRRRFYPGFSRRLGFLPEDLELDRPIWVHAVSVGEAVAARGLIEELRAAYPRKQFVISTVTPTGNRIARSIAQEGDFATYLPLDFNFIVRHVIDTLRPCLFIIVETELWPNLIAHLARRRIPLVMVNGRISDRSFSGYRRARFLFKPLLKKVALFCVQGERDASRLEALGVGREAIRVAGNMKFDIRIEYAGGEAEVRQRLGLGDTARLLVAGSTHPPEEEIILEAYRSVCKEFPGLRLLIAPRHPERAFEVMRMVRCRGATPVRMSQHGSARLDADSGKNVFILDTVGELLQFYACADIVFVGGSLARKGGHNILEPASFAKPILTGPHLYNFPDIAELFIAGGGCIVVRTPAQLVERIGELLRDPAAAGRLGEAGRSLIRAHQGATRRHAELLRRFTAC